MNKNHTENETEAFFAGQGFDVAGIKTMLNNINNPDPRVRDDEPVLVVAKNAGPGYSISRPPANREDLE